MKSAGSNAKKKNWLDFSPATKSDEESANKPTAVVPTSQDEKLAHSERWQQPAVIETVSPGPILEIWRRGAHVAGRVPDTVPIFWVKIRIRHGDLVPAQAIPPSIKWNPNSQHLRPALGSEEGERDGDGGQEPGDPPEKLTSDEEASSSSSEEEEELVEMPEDYLRWLLAQTRDTDPVPTLDDYCKIERGPEELKRVQDEIDWLQASQDEFFELQARVRETLHRDGRVMVPAAVVGPQFQEQIDEFWYGLLREHDSNAESNTGQVDVPSNSNTTGDAAPSD
ncbi:hypothetical protein BS78_05G192800 [Paspalum vaginatum]|nr:hypothetical protein BS78_05G192800 [Paspalum vaginatum]